MPSTKRSATSPSAPVPKAQTLLRGLDIIEAVAAGHLTIPAIARATGIAASTAHRLASSLVERHYLKFEPRKGYALGRKLIELGFKAHAELDLRLIARPYMEALALRTQDTIHLATRVDHQVTYLDKIEGRRAVRIGSRIGGRKPLCSTAVGKSLILDEGEASWARHLDAECGERMSPQARSAWLEQMREYARAGYTRDIGEDDPAVHCVAAPLRDGRGQIVAALSVSTTREYIDPQRLSTLIDDVREAARQISKEMGAGD